jgi:hypothetical protein
MSDRDGSIVVRHAEDLWRVATRRSFLKTLGVGGTIVLMPSVFAACDSGDDITGTGQPGSATLNLSTDVGILNYAFALEQLEAAFYTAVLGSAAFAGMSAEQKEVMTDLRNHEVVHREFLRAALNANAIGNLAFGSSAVGTAVASTSSILRNAEAFEDLGVAAYNGAGKYLQDGGNLLLAGKIVSVEARHAAAIRDLREGLGLGGTAPGTRFGGDDVVNAQGLDVKLEPATVLAGVVSTGLLTTNVSIGTQPTITTATADAPPPATP